jgi:hypothetical protein
MDNETKVLSKITLVDGNQEIEVEKSLSELKGELFDNSPVLCVTGTDNKHYVLPKMTVKLISSDNAV